MKTLSTIIILFFSLILGITQMNAQPVNDLIENAIDIDEHPIPFNDLAINFSTATLQNDITDQPGCELFLAGIWYKFTATSAATVTANLITNGSGWVVFFSAPNENVTSGLELTYTPSPNNSCGGGIEKSIETEPGTTYYIYMRSPSLNADVSIDLGGAIAPINDFIENAIDLNGFEDYSDQDVPFSFATSLNDGGQAGCDTQNSPGVWYKFSASIDGQVVAGIGIGPNDGSIIFYSALNENVTSGEELTYVPQQTNTCGPGNLSSIMAQAGTTYYIITGTNDAKATVSINLSGILATNENFLEGFSYYPNPVTNEINLTSKSNIDEVSFFNVVGQKVLSKKLGATHHSIDLSTLQTGLYIMEVSARRKTATYKIVKK